MSQTPQCISTPSDQSTLFSIMDLTNQSLRLPRISKGAQILLCELLKWSGERRYCWWSIPAIAKDLNWSASVVWRKSKELQKAGLLEVIPRPGRSNFWVPLPGRNRMERLQSEVAPLATPRVPFLKENEKLKRCTAPNLGTCTEETPPHPDPESNVNAVKICSEEMSLLQGTIPDIVAESVQEPIVVVQLPPHEPIRQKPAQPASVPKPKPKTQPPLTSEQMLLVHEIERATGDTWSRGHFVNLVRQVDEQTIYAALSITREKGSLESGVNLGAYFTATVKGLSGLASLGARPVSDVMTKQPPSGSPTTIPPARPTPRFLHPDEPEPEPLDPESLKRGLRLQYKASGVQGMLTLVQRCVPVSVDVGGLWSDVRETFSGVEEGILLDRFLDTVLTRAKHAERTAEMSV